MYDDLTRWQSDRKFNNRLIEVYLNGEWQRIPSQNICVGDLIRINRDQESPCDIVLLYCSSKNGIAYVQTTNIDGESDYKRRFVPKIFSSMNLQQLYSRHPVVEAQTPNPNLHSFDARLFPELPTAFSHLTRSPASNNSKESAKNKPIPFTIEEEKRLQTLLSTEQMQSACPLSVDNLIVQATTLRNTDYVVGVAVYTGRETKVSCNKSKPPTKLTHFEDLFSMMTFVIFGVQLTIVIIFAVGLIFSILYLLNSIIFMFIYYYIYSFCLPFTFSFTGGLIWRSALGDDEWYLDYTTGTYTWNLETLAFFLRFLTLMSLFIPISLKVTIDFVKLFSSLFISWDLSMWRDDPPEQQDPSKKRPSGHGAIAHSTALAEEMGQITHVLSDKTGTLTQNLMEFTRCAIDSLRYGLQELSTNSEHDEYADTQDKSHSSQAAETQQSPLLADTNLQSLLSAKNETALEFFRALAICHSIQTFVTYAPTFFFFLYSLYLFFYLSFCFFFSFFFFFSLYFTSVNLDS